MEQETEEAAGPSELQLPDVRKRKEDKKNHKKDTKTWENLMKLVTPLELNQKFKCLEEHFMDLLADVRNLTKVNQQLTLQFGGLQKDKDFYQSELGKTVLAKARLENLCREMQKQNKEIKEENLAKLKAEEERRREVSLQFSKKLNHITVMMDKNKERNEELHQENLRTTDRLSELTAQFQQRESDIANLTKQLDLERQLTQANIAKMELEKHAERENQMREHELLKRNLEKSETNCAVLMETVKGLQDHINIYKNQYQDFENTMSKSTKVFDNFKVEIANMTKKTTRLETEANSWKKKFHDSTRALVEMSEMNKELYSRIQALEKKVELSHRVCKQLQADRAKYINVLKTHKIDITSLSEEDETEVINTDKQNSITKKEKELNKLKDRLQNMQIELNRLTEEPETVQIQNVAESLMDTTPEIEKESDVESKK